jgi:hypothetical protein
VKDGFQTDSVWLCAVLCYTYTFDALLEISITTGEGKKITDFFLDIPSLDAAEIDLELKEGRLQISDCNALIKNYSRVTGLLKQLHREGRQSWKSHAYQEAWCAGKFPDGRKIK